MDRPFRCFLSVPCAGWRAEFDIVSPWMPKGGIVVEAEGPWEARTEVATRYRQSPMPLMRELPLVLIDVYPLDRPTGSLEAAKRVAKEWNNGQAAKTEDKSAAGQ